MSEAHDNYERQIMGTEAPTQEREEQRKEPRWQVSPGGASWSGEQRFL